MIDERFSLDEFTRCGTNSDESGRLSVDLQEAIADELVEEVRKLATLIADRLALVGHSCIETAVETEPGGMVGVTFVDVRNGDDRSKHLLRFNLNIVVSAGFPGYVCDESQDSDRST